MTPDEIKAQQARVKAQQTELQRRGLYKGKLDGVMGNDTSDAQKEADRIDAAAAAAALANKSTEADNAVKLLNAQTAAKAAEAEGKAKDAATAETLAKAARKQKYDEDANSMLGLGAQVASGPAALAGGKLIGLGGGNKLNAKMDAGQAKSNEVLARAAEDRVKGLTTREGAITGARLAGVMPPENAIVRVGSRLAPHLGIGAALAGTGAYTESQVDPDQPFYPRMAERAFGMGNIGAGIGLMTQGAKQAIKPGVAPDAAALSVINSSGLRRGNNETPPDVPDAPKLTQRQQLVADAKAAGITGTGKMNMTTLSEKLALAKQAATPLLTKLPSVAGPGIAAALAYGATPDSANAATPDGAPPPSRTAEALTNAALVGGGTYGFNKGMQALPAVVGKAAGAGASMLNPGMMADAYDPTPEKLNQDRLDVANMLPAWARVGKIGQEYDMAQTPEPSPVPRTERLQNAAALQIPDNIPPNAARDAEMAAQAQEGGPAPGPQGGAMPSMEEQIKILQAHGAPPAIIQQYVAHMGAGQ